MRKILAFGRQRYLEIIFLYVALQLVVSGVSGWLTRGPLIIIGVVLFAVVSVYLILSERRQDRMKPALGTEIAFQRHRQAVVFTVGFRPFEKSICPVVLDHLPEVRIVGLLASPEVMTGYYDSYRTALEQRRLVVEVATWDGYDFADIVAQTDALLKKLVDKHELVPADIVVDATSGTVLMSLGAFYAAEQHGVECQVIAATYDREANKVIPSTVRPILTVSHLPKPEPGGG